MEDQKIKNNDRGEQSDQNAVTDTLQCHQPEIIVSEYIPTGPTHSNIFREELEIPRGKRKRMFLARQQDIDRTPEKMTISTSSGLAETHVKEITDTEVRFSFQIFFPKEKNTKHSEKIGCTVKQNGEISYGAKITEINGKESQKLSLLHNLLVEFNEDTSKAMHTLLSSYQRRVLDIIFPQAEQVGSERAKAFAITTTKTNPPLTEKVLQQASYRSILRQLLGPIQQTALEKETKILYGEKGILIVTNDPESIRESTKFLLRLKGLSLFIQNYLEALWNFWNELSLRKKDIRAASDTDSNIEIAEIREEFLDTNRSVIMLDHLNTKLLTTLRQCEEKIKDVQREDFLLPVSKGNLVRKTKKLQEQLSQARELSKALTQESNGIARILNTLMDKKLQEIIEAQEKLTKRQIESNESMDILQILFTLTATLEGLGILAQYFMTGNPQIGFLLLGIGLVPTLIALYLVYKK